MTQPRRRFTDRSAMHFTFRIYVLVSLLGIMAMLALSGIIVKQFRDLQLRNAREIGSAYIQGILAPYAMEAVRDGRLSDQSITDLGSSVARAPTMRQFDARQIWSTGRDRWFNSGAVDPANDHDNTNLDTALRGRTVASIKYPESGADEDSQAQIEIYAPIFRPGTADLIAVGEVYMDAQPLLADRARFESVLFVTVGLATAGFLLAIFLFARQQRDLSKALAEESKAARLNDELRQSVETSWRTSSQSNEALLNQLGAELHDGPIQMLSLAALMAPPSEATAPQTQPSAQAIARDVLADLRRIAVGLILPELGSLTTLETIALAVNRHKDATGTEVVLDTRALPAVINDQRKICIYRVVQEGLNNAFRHGGGLQQSVTVHQNGGLLNIVVKNSNNGHQNGADTATRTRHSGLGIPGLRNRLKVFGGTLDAQANADGVFTLTATLPLDEAGYISPAV